MTKPKAKTETVEIQNVMAAGKLFTSLGILMPGEKCELPSEEAKHFVGTGKAKIPFPETATDTSEAADSGPASEDDPP